MSEKIDDFVAVNVEHLRAETMKKLEDGSICLSGTVIENGRVGFTDIKPFTWNSNDGVLVYGNEKGKMMAIPYTPEVVNVLANGGFDNDEHIGVPNLNQKDAWKQGGDREAEEYQDFRDWARNVEKAKQGFFDHF